MQGRIRACNTSLPWQCLLPISACELPIEVLDLGFYTSHHSTPETSMHSSACSPAACPLLQERAPIAQEHIAAFLAGDRSLAPLQGASREARLLRRLQECIVEEAQVSSSTHCCPQRPLHKGPLGKHLCCATCPQELTYVSVTQWERLAAAPAARAANEA